MRKICQNCEKLRFVARKAKYAKNMRKYAKKMRPVVFPPAVICFQCISQKPVGKLILEAAEKLQKHCGKLQKIAENAEIAVKNAEN